jgi:hypothetical protein
MFFRKTQGRSDRPTRGSRHARRADWRRFEPEALEPRALLSVATEAGATGTWTVMVYITADDLAANAPGNLIEMERLAARLPDSVRIMVLYDQWQPMPFATGNGTQAPWGTAGFAQIQGDPHPEYSRNARNPPPRIATTFQIGPEQDTGNPATLASFIVDAAQAAPAQNYALIMWDHGGSVEGLNFDHDDGLPDDNLTVTKVVGALQQARVDGVALSLLAFDECLMGSVEVAYAVRDLVPYMVGSEELEDGTGYDYEDALGVLARDPASVTPAELATSIVDSFGRSYAGTTSPNDTQSAIRTDRLDGLIDALATFTTTTERARPSDWAALRRARSVAEKFGGDNPAYPYRDLGQFLESVAFSADAGPIRESASAALRALDEAVIARTPSKRDVLGLSVTMPAPGEAAPRDYARLAPEFTSMTGWDDFLRRFRTAGAGPACDDPVDWAEDNNTLEAATVLGMVSGPGTSFRELTLPHGDLDWYRFSTADVGRRGDAIRLAGVPSDAGVRLQLFQDGKALTLVGRGRTEISLEGMQDGNYLLLVSRAGGGEGFGYNLVLDTPDDPDPESFPRDNTDIDHAADLGLVIDSRVAAVKNGTEDQSVFTRADASQAAWYSFSTPRSISPMSGTISVYGASGRLAVTLYDEQGRPIRAASRGRSVQIPYSVSGTGERYYVSVGGDAGNYQIFFTSLSASPGRVPGSQPPNAAGARRFSLSSAPRGGPVRGNASAPILARARAGSSHRPPARR